MVHVLHSFHSLLLQLFVAVFVAEMYLSPVLFFVFISVRFIFFCYHFQSLSFSCFSFVLFFNLSYFSFSFWKQIRYIFGVCIWTKETYRQYNLAIRDWLWDRTVGWNKIGHLAALPWIIWTLSYGNCLFITAKIILLLMMQFHLISAWLSVYTCHWEHAICHTYFL